MYLTACGINTAAVQLGILPSSQLRQSFQLLEPPLLVQIDLVVAAGVPDAVMAAGAE